MIDLPLEVDPVTRIVVESLQGVASVAQGDIVDKTLPEAIDVDMLFERSLAMGLVQSVATAYSADDAVNDEHLPFKRYDTVAEHVFHLQVDCWRDVVCLLEDEGIPSLLLKGAFVFGVLWPGPKRLMADIDLLIPRDQSERAQELVMTVLDYLQGQSLDAVRGHRRTHYELAILYQTFRIDEIVEHKAFIRRYRLSDRENLLTDRERDGRRDEAFGLEPIETTWWDIEFDLHHNVIQPALDAAELWTEPLSITFGGREARAVRPEVTAWLLATRCMAELALGELQAARMLHDLVVLCCTVSLDYDELDRMTRRHANEDICYSVFRFLQEDIGVPVPAGFVQGLERRSRGRLGVGDRVGRRMDNDGLHDIVPLLFSLRVAAPRGRRVVYRWGASA